MDNSDTEDDQDDVNNHRNTKKMAVCQQGIQHTVTQHILYDTRQYCKVIVL